jgi:hypothetical protein
MRKLIESLNHLTEERGTRFVDRVAQGWELFLRDVGDALAKEMQAAGYDTKRVRAESGNLWADFVPRTGFKPAEPDFVPPKYVRFWVQIARDGVAQCTMDLPNGFNDIGKRNLIDDRDARTPEGLANYLAGSDGRMDVLGTWG